MQFEKQSHESQGKTLIEDCISREINAGKNYGPVILYAGTELASGCGMHFFLSGEIKLYWL